MHRIWCMLTLIQVAASQMTTYTITNLSYYSAPSVGSPSKAASLLACIVLCYSRIDSCFSATYNKITGSCTPQAEIKYTPSNPPRAPEELYLYTDHCNTSLGFTLYVHGSVVQCLHVSITHVNFTSAREICAEKGSTLYLVKSRDKFQLLQRLIREVTFSNTWVGLSDLEEEGTFVWDDSTIPAYPIPWRPRQPDNDQEEDCVIVERLTYYLNDYGCSKLNSLICEQKAV